MQNVGVGDKAGLAVESSNGVDGCGTVDVGHSVKDPLHLVSVLDDWAKVRVCCAMLGSRIHFRPFFWLTKVTVIYLALVRSSGTLCAMISFRAVLKMRLTRSTHLVHPGVAGLEYS